MTNIETAEQLAIWTAEGCEEFVIAASAEEARGVMVGIYGADNVTDDEDCDDGRTFLDPVGKWWAYAPDRTFTCDDDGTHVVKPARDFVASHPRGYFASANY